MKLTTKTVRLTSIEPNHTLTQNNLIMSLFQLTHALFSSHTNTHSCLTKFPVMGLIKAPPAYEWSCVYLPTAALGKPKPSDAATLKASAVK